VAGAQMVERAIAVEKAPARLGLQAIRMKVDDNAVLQVTAEAQDAGGDPYDGALVLKVDGSAGKQQPLQLQPGEKRRVNLGYTFAVGGMHRVQLNDQPEQQIVVPGGLSLGLQNPQVYLKLDEAQGTTAKNEITGKDLNLKGTPGWTGGKSGQALQLARAGMGVNVEHLDIYRKPFTLSAWVKIDALGKNDDLGLFGGQAPMGADQDNTGTQLHVGVHNKKPFMGFLGRDITGGKQVPVGSWVNLTYTYDPLAEKGSLYLNGSLDKSTAQKPYAGPLETIGDAPLLDHGSYALDEVVVVQSCLSPQMVRQLSEQGLESLRHGNYSSQWQALSGSPQTLDVIPEIPAGTKISVTVETANKDGKVLGSSAVDLVDGKQSYPLSGVQAGDQVRLRVQLSSTVWGASPVLRSATVTGAAGKQTWSTPHEWAKGNADSTLIMNCGQSGH